MPYAKLIHNARALRKYSSLVLTIILIVAPLATAGYQKELIIKSGDPAPGTNGAIFSTNTFDSPTPIGIDDSGHVLFRATLEQGVGGATFDNMFGIWEMRDTLRLIVRKGDPVLDFPGHIYLDAPSTVFYDLKGGIAFEARILDATDPEAIPFFALFVVDQFGEPRLWAFDDLLYTDLLGSEFIFERNIPIAYNDKKFLVASSVRHERIRPDGAFLLLDGPLHSAFILPIVAYEFEQMPLQQPEWVLRDVGQVSAGLPLLESGDLIFQVKGRNTVSGDFKGIVYSFNGIDQYDVFRESAFNQQNSVFGEWRLSFFGDVFQLGWAEVGVSKGIFGFSVDLLGNNQADLYVQEGAMLPGSNGASISSFEEFFAFDDGTVGFKVRLSDNKLGVWRDSVGTLNQKIILAGDPLPGIPPASNFGFISNLAANTEGYVAFMDQFVDGPNFFSGLWVANVAGIEPVCVGGETIEVEPGVTKTVNDVLSGQFSGTRTGADGHPTTLNLDGAVPFRVQFIEGGYALMLGKPSSIVVNSTGDDPDIDPNDGFCYTGTILPDGSLECTMRAAIMESNARGDNETITFDIPETPTIQPASCLPLITDSVLIDGTTQPGPDPVILDGVNAGDCNGLTVLTNECTIKGLSIGRFGLNGISVVGDDGLSGDESVKVFGCRLGFETDMGATFGNNLDGIQISATVNTQVGGPAAGEGNVITHNSRNGVDIDGSEDTRVIGNTIGSNEGDGVIIDEASLNSVLDLNHIGVSEGGDLIGNSGWGISVHGQSNDAVVGSAPTPPSAVASRLIPPAGNRVSHNLEGGVFVANSNRPDIRDNQFTGNVGPGIEFDSTTTFGVISSNVISGNLSSGVVIRNSDEVTIEKNLIGLDSVGSGAMGNGHDGVLITDATGATISDNYIAANSRNGVTLDSGSTFCAVRRNKVGVTPLNTSAGNDESGVHIMNQSNVNSVGDVFGGNVISNNSRGVSVHNSSLITIDKNLIGLDTTGVNPMGDFFGDGIRIINSSSNDITDNYVTNSTFHGILVDSGSNTNTLTNNKVGLNKTGNSAGNPIGILIANGSENNIIGGGHQKGNVISANTTFGLQIKNSDKTLIQGNIIGLDTTGTVSMGNGEDGIRISNSLQTTVGVGVDQFGVLTGDGNVVSGNDSTGIRLENSDFTTIYSNIIGAAIDTVTELPNSWGIWIFGESETFIGGLDGAQPTLGNFVVGNRSTGIGIESNLCDISGNTIANNGYVLIPGQSETGGNGVYLKGESNRVGMTNPLFKNTIRNNNGAGVYVDFEFRGMDQRNTIRFNSIYDNTNGGIDVAPFGPNPNDSLDIDDGPNAGQNKPQLNVAEITGSGQLFVAGNLSSEPNKRYAIDFYSNDVCDPAGLGQGKDWLFSDTVVTGSDGLAKFISLASPTAPLAGLSLTATATAIIEDGFGVFSAHTSEFSNCLAMIPQEPGVDIHVEKTDNLLETTTGDTSAYTITVTNIGSDTATNVLLLDTLPGQLSYLSDSTNADSCVFSDGVMTCNAAALSPGEAFTVIVRTKVNDTGLIVNQSLATTPDLDIFPTNNIARDSTFARAPVVSCCDLPGDANNDNTVNIGDITFIVNRLFHFATPPLCCAEADVNSDSRVNILDITTLVAWLFSGGADPICGPPDLVCD